MKILFMGTPSFASYQLEKLWQSGEEIVGVVTAPDRPKGRGMVLTPSDVKVTALSHNLPVFQPKTLKDGAFLQTLEELKPELIVVVAYGRILPKYVLDYPKYRCINVHASLLPEYRGAAPIQRAIIDGKTETGVTVMKMEEGLDTGDMIHVEKVKIGENDNFETVHDRLMEAGAKGLLHVVAQIKNQTVTFTPQGETFTYAQKIEKEDCHIDFSSPMDVIHNQIRGLSPIPLAFAYQNGKILKIACAHKTELHSDLPPKTVVSVEKGIFVQTGDGVLSLDIVVPEGKGKMSGADYANGKKIEVGQILE